MPQTKTKRGGHATAVGDVIMSSSESRPRARSGYGAAESRVGTREADRVKADADRERRRLEARYRDLIGKKK